MKNWKKEFDKKFPNKNIGKRSDLHFLFTHDRKNINLPIKIKRFITKLLKENN